MYCTNILLEFTKRSEEGKGLILNLQLRIFQVATSSRISECGCSFKYSLHVSVHLIIERGAVWEPKRGWSFSQVSSLSAPVEHISSIMYWMILNTHEVKFGSLIYVFSLLAVLYITISQMVV